MTVSDNNMKQFINFGQAMLTQLTEVNVYDDAQSGKTLEECAELCLRATHYHCKSFDYLHEVRARCGMTL